MKGRPVAKRNKKSSANVQQTESQQCISITNANVRALPLGPRVDGCVARQQQLGDLNMTFGGGYVEGVPPE